jgi:hypothetical protein
VEPDSLQKRAETKPQKKPEAKLTDTMSVDFTKQTDAELEETLTKMRREAAQVYRGYSIVAFNFVLRETPQWTGNAAANWNYDVGGASYAVDKSFMITGVVDDFVLPTVGKRYRRMEISDINLIHNNVVAVVFADV